MSNEGAGPSYEEIAEAARLAREAVDRTRRKLEAGERMAEALQGLIAQFEDEIHSEYQGTSLLEGRLAEVEVARAALRAWKETGK